MSIIQSLFNYKDCQPQYKSNDLFALIAVQSNRIHELEEQIVTLKDENSLLHTDNQRLLFDNQELVRRINLNNTNSNIPSGLVIFKTNNKNEESIIKLPDLPITEQTQPEPNLKNKDRSLRKKGGKIGGQYGHTGITLSQVAKPDRVEYHKVTSCNKCNTELSEAKIINIIKRQEFELPVIRLEVTEHQVESKYCPCCSELIIAKCPISAPVQYGNRARSFLTYLNVYHHIPLVHQFFNFVLYQLAPDTIFLTLFWHLPL